jgi:hypothetical protein
MLATVGKRVVRRKGARLSRTPPMQKSRPCPKRANCLSHGIHEWMPMRTGTHHVIKCLASSLAAPTSSTLAEHARQAQVLTRGARPMGYSSPTQRRPLCACAGPGPGRTRSRHAITLLNAGELASHEQARNHHGTWAQHQDCDGARAARARTFSGAIRRWARMKRYPAARGARSSSNSKTASSAGSMGNTEAFSARN